MAKTTVFKTFNELFEAAVLKGLISLEEHERFNQNTRNQLKAASSAYYETLFKIHLNHNLGVKENDAIYKKELTIASLVGFIKEKEKRQKRIRSEVEEAKKTWQKEDALPSGFDIKNPVIAFNQKKFKLNFPALSSFVPKNVEEYFRKHNEYVIFSTATAKEIPVLKRYWELRGLVYKNREWLSDDFQIVFDCYAIGFLKGFENDFIPSIDTPENKRELILKAIGGSKMGFPTSFRPIDDPVENERSAHFDCNSFYEMGLKYGENYKAWRFVLETPKYFQNEFPFVKPQQKKVDVPSESKAGAGKYNTKIFTGYKGFQIFEAFKNEMITERTEYADYSFLFEKLKKDEFIHTMTHKKFIDWLGQEYQAKFAASYKQFKYSETAAKKKAYSRFKNQFQ